MPLDTEQPFVSLRPLSDRRRHRYAVARLDLWTAIRFELDHVKQTATVESTFPREAVTSSAKQGVTATIRPWADTHMALFLNGLSLQLMGAPFNGDTTYRIVSW